MRKISILDTTLRDGAQGAGIQFSLEDRIQIARILDDFGVDFIEAGILSSSPAERDFFRACPPLKTARLTAFGATMRRDGTPETDPGLAALLETGTEAVTLFGKSWLLHVEEVLHCSPKENLRLCEQSAAYLKQQGRFVIFDAEHFFDGYQDDPEYALEVLRAVARGGADILTLCDTNGGCLPDESERIIRAVTEKIPAPVGVHFHNDTGMAAAASVLAALCGAAHVQGTIGGLGERCGNADLIPIIAGLQLKRGCECVPPESMEKLCHLARAVAEIANVRLPEKTPYVGDSAFRHKAGMHIDGVIKNPRTFEHIEPETVGNERRFLPSEMSGRSLLLHQIQSLHPALKKDSPEVASLLRELKARTGIGYTYEAAEASFELLILRHLGLYQELFDLISLKTFSEQPAPGGSATAIINIRVGEKEALSAGQGDGPVHALNNALSGALRGFYPEANKIRLIDYKVRVLNSQAATAARVRVLITSTDGERNWTTVGVSEDIIMASWQALSDSVEYALLRKQND